MEIILLPWCCPQLGLGVCFYGYKSDELNKVPQTLMYKLHLFDQILCQEKLGAWLPHETISFVSWMIWDCKSSPSVVLSILLHLRNCIDWLHKWWPKKYSFLFMLIRLTSLVGMDKMQKKCSFRTRVVGLVSTKTKEYFFGCHWFYAIGLY